MMLHPPYKLHGKLHGQQTLYTAFDVVPAPKGASTHITQFTRALVAAGAAVSLITANDGTLPPHEQYVGAQMLRVPAQPDASTTYLDRAEAFSAFVAQHIASAPGYAVGHVRSVWGGWPLLAAQRRGLRLLCEINGLPSVELKYHYPALAGAPLIDTIQARELTMLAAADAIVCVSQVTRLYLISLGIMAEKITVIPNGVDVAHFSPTPLPQRAPDDPPVLLYIGTLADWQGLRTLLEAMPLLLAERPVRLRIVGRGRNRQRKALRKHAEGLGIAAQVTIDDPVPHDAIPALIAGADVCVAPLGYNDRNVVQGCCPLKILEYMACERPVVAANLPVVRELAHADHEALLFTPDAPDALARAVLTLLADPTRAAQMAAHGAERVRREFTWDIAGDRLIEVYARLLSSSSRLERPVSRL
ncbi:MAG: glycosyltransferase family 4 protein [Chloroflexi bacterium]|nr:glycosyltransferase family 4 protein [Chloroflexota bacterium]